MIRGWEFYARIPGLMVWSTLKVHAIVVFTNKRSQAKVFTVYLSLAAGYSYLECNNHTLALYTLSAELNQWTKILIYTTLLLASQELAHPTRA